MNDFFSTHRRGKVRWELEGAHKTAQQHARPEEEHRRVENCKPLNDFGCILSGIFAPQVFYNWKGQLRTRAKKLKQIQDGKTGVDDKLALQKLTDVEKRALKLWREDFQDKDIASVSLKSPFLIAILTLANTQNNKLFAFLATKREGTKHNSRIIKIDSIVRESQKKRHEVRRCERISIKIETQKIKRENEAKKKVEVCERIKMWEGEMMWEDFKERTFWV